MKAKPEQHRAWQDLHSRGDINKIAAESGISRQTIAETFNTGIGTDRVITAINDFYLARKQSQDQVTAALTGDQESE